MTCIPADRNPGEYDLERLPKGWANFKVTLECRDGREKTRYEILDVRSRKAPYTRYQQEPLGLTAFKCFELVLALPFYFLGYGIFHLVRLPIVTLVHLSPSAFFKQIWTLVRIPFYFVALEFSALYGIFKPLEGRALFSSWEKALHDGKERYDDILRHDIGPFWKQSCSAKEDPNTCFLAFCLQPLGRTDAPHIKKVRLVDQMFLAV